MLTTGVVIHLDNSLPLTDASTLEMLQYLCWELFDYMPHSSDLAPRDFHLFTYMRSDLSYPINNNDELV
jgi:hypothetical protein